MESEKDVEANLRRAFMRAGWETDKIKATSDSGFPDRFFCKEGLVGLIEVKGTDEMPSEKQLRRIRRFIAAGIDARVIDTTIDGLRLLEFWELTLWHRRQVWLWDAHPTHGLERLAASLTWLGRHAPLNLSGPRA